eukprot:12290001-Alexandrium_andersonii.AAC.1
MARKPSCCPATSSDQLALRPPWRSLAYNHRCAKPPQALKSLLDSSRLFRAVAGHVRTRSCAVMYFQVVSGADLPATFRKHWNSQNVHNNSETAI